MWIVHPGDNCVSIVDVQTNAFSILPVNRNPHALVFDGICVWIASSLDNNIMRINVANRAIEAIIGVGQGPRALAYDGTHIWVSSVKPLTVAYWI